MVGLTFLAAIAALVSAWLFEAQLVEARRSYRLDERAWVELEPIKVQNVQGKDFDYSIVPRNIGKTAARNVDFSIDPVDSDEDISHDEKKIEVERNSMQRISKGIGNVGVMVPNSTPPIPFTFRGHAQEDKNFYALIGYFNYVDQFGSPHWKTFCFRATEKPGEFEYCDYGNDEDNNPE